MLVPILEPICAGIVVSLINKFMFNSHSALWHSCYTTNVDTTYEDDTASTITAVSNVSLEAHIHIH